VVEWAVYAGEPAVALVDPSEQVADRGGAEARRVAVGALSSEAREGVERVQEAAVLGVDESLEDAQSLRGLGAALGLRPRELPGEDVVPEHVVPLAGLGPAAERDGAEDVRGVEEEGPRGEEVAEGRGRAAGEAEVAGGGQAGGGEEEAGEGAREVGAPQRLLGEGEGGAVEEAGSVPWTREEWGGEGGWLVASLGFPFLEETPKRSA
jgi:hypothetical protein